jgi:hypothetical protein
LRLTSTEQRKSRLSLLLRLLTRRMSQLSA